MKIPRKYSIVILNTPPILSSHGLITGMSNAVLPEITDQHPLFHSLSNLITRPHHLMHSLITSRGNRVYCNKVLKGTILLSVHSISIPSASLRPLTDGPFSGFLLSIHPSIPSVPPSMLGLIPLTQSSMVQCEWLPQVVEDGSATVLTSLPVTPTTSGTSAGPSITIICLLGLCFVVGSNS